MLAGICLGRGGEPKADPCRKRRASSSGSEQELTLKKQQLCDGEGAYAHHLFMFSGTGDPINVLCFYSIPYAATAVRRRLKCVLFLTKCLVDKVEI